MLEGLLRQGIDIPHSCRSGVCQSCLMRASNGNIPERAQRAIKETLKRQGYFLSCVCYPESDLEIVSSEELRTRAEIAELYRLSNTVLLVRLLPQTTFDYFPGQFLSLIREDGLTRSYSIASQTSEPFLELHIRKIANGEMSSWLFEQARVGDKVYIQGPAGSCFYLPGRPQQPLVLAGTGTGLAPLYAIARDALSQKHKADIWLFHGAVTQDGLYLVEELESLSRDYANFNYYPSVLEAGADADLQVGSIDQVLLATLPKPIGWRAFVCGSPDIVDILKKKLFIAGVSMKDIYADAFLPSQNNRSS